MLANHPNVLGRGMTASSLNIGNVDGPASGGSTDNALVRWDGTTGRLIQNGVVTEADNTGNLTGATDQATTTAAGSAFTNQPANDSVTLVSNSASDTQTATIIGTTNGVDTVVTEAVVLTGTTPAVTVKVDWGIILAIKLSSVAVGTITATETSGAQTITTIAPAASSKGVTTVTNTAAFNRAVSAVASGSSTKQLGFGGTNTSGTQIYDSKPLNGTTAVTSNSSFYTLTEVYRGDLEAARTATVTTNGGWTLTGGGGGTVTFSSLSTGIAINGNLTFGTAGSILNGTTGAQGITVTGTNQSWTLTPSGSGSVIISKGSDNQLILNATTGSQYTSMYFQNNNVNKAQFFWDNSGNRIVFGTVNAGAVIDFKTANDGQAVRIAATGNTLFGGLTADDTNCAIQANGCISGQTFIQAYSTTPHTLTSVQSMYTFSNTGAIALNVINLPAGAVNLIYTFVVTDTDGIKAVANGTDTIRVAGSVSGAGGNVQATALGATITLVCAEANKWTATAVNGTWTVT